MCNFSLKWDNRFAIYDFFIFTFESSHFIFKSQETVGMFLFVRRFAVCLSQLSFSQGGIEIFYAQVMHADQCVIM